MEEKKKSRRKWAPAGGSERKGAQEHSLRKGSIKFRPSKRSGTSLIKERGGERVSG